MKSFFLNLSFFSLGMVSVIYFIYSLNFIADLPEFSKSLDSNYTLDEDINKNMSWTCIASASPELTITWMVNGALPGEGLSVQQKVTKLHIGYEVESTLKISSITRNRSSIISCNAVNSFGNISSASNIIINCKFVLFL